MAMTDLLLPLYLLHFHTLLLDRSDPGPASPGML